VLTANRFELSVRYSTSYFVEEYLVLEVMVCALNLLLDLKVAAEEL
jgi:hypothetical protein